jgi:hypothetical protein
MNARRLTLTAVMAAFACALLALSAGSAFAGSAHVFSKSFGSAGAEAGEVSSPEGLAVDNSAGPESGDVYVADTGNHRVDQFDAEGNFIRAWGWGVADGLAMFETCGPGAFPASATCKAGISGSNPGQFKAPAVIAVDGSSGLSSGDVYVGDGETALVQKFSPTGELISSWGDSTPAPNGQLAGTNAANGPFVVFPASVAVDTSGNLWVQGSGGGGVFEFDQSGGFIQSWFSGLPQGQIAVDGNGNVYSQRSEAIEKLSSGGYDLGEVVQDHEVLRGLTVDQATGELYVDQGGHSIQRVDSPCEPSVAKCHVGETFGATHLTGGAGLAVDSATGVVYVADATANQIQLYSLAIEVVTDTATNVTATSATLNGTVNPDGSLVGDCHFEYGPTEAYGQSAPCVGSPGSGTTAMPVKANIGGLQGGTTYHFRLVASNAKVSNFDGPDEVLPTLPVPVVEGASAANLTATSVDLTAKVNPAGVTVEGCTFEYGTEVGVYPHRIECAPSAALIGAGTEPVAVTAHLTELKPNIAYHWRLVADNQNGSTITPDHVFVYDTTGGGLPDGRAYEMVTPPGKNAALIGDVITAAKTDIAVDGSRVIATSIQCFAGSESCTAARAYEGEPFVFTRTATGWVTSALAPSAALSDGNSYWLGSGETGDALLSIPTAPGGEDDWYVRSPGGTLSHIGPTSQPSLGPLGVNPFGAELITATADFSHLAWESASVWPSLEGVSPYEYVGADDKAPVLVGVSGGAGSHDLISACGTTLGGPGVEAVNRHGSMSEDGSVVFFTAGKCTSGTGENAGRRVPAAELYARIDQDRTVPISQRSATECKTTECEDSQPGSAIFQGASTDGSKVFFTSSQQLTDDAAQGSNNNLYEYDFSAMAGHNLTAVSAGDTSGGGPRVQGVVAISADGSHIYFVAQGVLTDQANSQGQVALNANNNLYVSAAGHLAFIAALPSPDPIESANGQQGALWAEGAGEANTTPDGRFLVFSSHGALTSDDTRTDGGQQVFEYDAQTGSLVRISIGNDGFDDDGNAGFGAASIVAPTNPTSNLRTDPTMSHDGSYVFFQSPVGLTPQAINDVQIGTTTELGPTEGSTVTVPVYAENVYEYHGGHVYLISDGRDTGLGAEGTLSDVRLLGSDGSGANVFFTTSDPLVPTDTDTQADFYDARICTPTDPCIPPPAAALSPCDGESCHGVPAATPSLLTPGTASFNGEGNLAPISPAVVKPKSLTKAQKLATALKACRKDRRKAKRKGCEVSVRKRYGAVKKAKKSINDRRGK